MEDDFDEFDESEELEEEVLEDDELKLLHSLRNGNSNEENI